MAKVPFTYNGEQYVADTTTNPPVIMRQSGANLLTVGPTEPINADVKFRDALNQAVAGGSGATNTTTPSAPATATPATPAAAAPAAPGWNPLPSWAGGNNTASGAPSAKTVIPGPAKPTPGSDTLTNPQGTGNAPAEPAPAPAAADTSGTAPAPAAAAATGRAARATELRAARDRIQNQIDTINAGVNDDNPLTPGQATNLNNLQTQLTSYDNQITAQEKEPTTTVVSGTSSKDHYITTIQDNVLTSKINPNWDGTKGDETKYTTVQSGNNTYTFNPQTGDLTLAFSDNDAKQLANKQADVAGKNADTERLRVDAANAADKARVEIEQRVANGEDAASVRAEKQLEVDQKFKEWQQADGDAKRSQTALDSYNVERHAVAKDTLDQNDYLEKVRAAKATEAYNQQKLGLDTQTTREATAAGMRNADVSAAGTKYSADQTAVTARLNAANSMLQSGMSMLAEVNKTLPPGSDLAGKALEGLMAYGQKFLTGMAGPAPTMAAAPSLGSYGLPGVGDTTANAPTTGTAALSGMQNALGGDLKPTVSSTDNAQQQVLANNGPGQVQKNLGVDLTQMPGGPKQSTDLPFTPQDIPTPAWATDASTAAGTAVGQSFGSTPNAPSAASPTSNTNMANLFSNADPSQALFEQNAAAHQATMQQPVAPPQPNLAPDGTPYAGAADVAKVWGRAA